MVEHLLDDFDIKLAYAVPDEIDSWHCKLSLLWPQSAWCYGKRIFWLKGDRDNKNSRYFCTETGDLCYPFWPLPISRNFWKSYKKLFPHFCTYLPNRSSYTYVTPLVGKLMFKRSQKILNCSILSYTRKENAEKPSVKFYASDSSTNLCVISSSATVWEIRITVPSKVSLVLAKLAHSVNSAQFSKCFLFF